MQAIACDVGWNLCVRRTIHNSPHHTEAAMAIDWLNCWVLMLLLLLRSLFFDR